MECFVPASSFQRHHLTTIIIRLDRSTGLEYDYPTTAPNCLLSNPQPQYLAKAAMMHPKQIQLTGYHPSQFQKHLWSQQYRTLLHLTERGSHLMTNRDIPSIYRYH